MISSIETVRMICPWRCRGVHSGSSSVVRVNREVEGGVDEGGVEEEGIVDTGVVGAGMVAVGVVDVEMVGAGMVDAEKLELEADRRFARE